MDWSFGDYAAAATLLAGFVFGAAIALKTSGQLAYRAAAFLALLSVLALIWINGAVGIIGSQSNAANLMYAAVLAIGLGGAVMARLRAAGMALTLALMAGAQVLIGLIAWLGGMGSGSPSWPQSLIGVTVIFAGAFLGAAALFRAAARAQAAASLSR
ncbi:MAG: hypothetical protein VX529_04990 [Pseudomonadota bacterium]|jgi:hypothetical protein|nr:hypothetical protein [Pseudomonadota bacterium]